MAWNVFSGSVRGARVQGDKTVSPTRWWNHIFLALWGWKKCAVLHVENEGTATNGYRVGYVPFKGPTRLFSKIQTSYGIRLKIGHEDCTFFAVDRDGREIPLHFLKIVCVEDKNYGDSPLL